MGYVIICHGNGKFDGWYVSENPDPHSYTDDIRKAKVFHDYDKAKSACCGNESPVSIESQMSGVRAWRLAD